MEWLSYLLSKLLLLMNQSVYLFYALWINCVDLWNIFWLVKILINILQLMLCSFRTFAINMAIFSPSLSLSLYWWHFQTAAQMTIQTSCESCITLACSSSQRCYYVFYHFRTCFVRSPHVSWKYILFLAVGISLDNNLKSPTVQVSSPFGSCVPKTIIRNSFILIGSIME